MSELLTALTRKAEYGNCHHLDRLKSAARQAKRELIKKDEQLAVAKAEIADYRAMIESIVIDAKGYESRSGSLPLWAKDADVLLEKHKAE